MKKLNNKGFTLIELLAVIVILAVVMGVAASSVLTAMSNSKRSSLENSSLSAADALRAAYAENMLTNESKIWNVDVADSYNPLVSSWYTKLNISEKNYTAGAAGASLDNGKATGSLAYFSEADGAFTVCLVANPKGSYYVRAAANYTATGLTQGDTPIVYEANTMFACSNGYNSWTNPNPNP